MVCIDQAGAFVFKKVFVGRKEVVVAIVGGSRVVVKAGENLSGVAHGPWQASTPAPSP